MQAIEFQTTVKNGLIEIPRQYRKDLQTVRVILLVEDTPQAKPNLIDELLEHPLKVPGFQPLEREALHA